MTKIKKIRDFAIIFLIALIIYGIVIFIFSIFGIDVKPFGKEDMGKYDKLILSQYSYLNKEDAWIYILPEKYYFFGRPDFYISIDEWENGQPVLDDRLVSKGFFSYNNKDYYFYYSDFQMDKNCKFTKRGGFFEYIWQDIYNADTDEIAYTLYDNPEGLFITDEYLYFTYGKNFYNYSLFEPYYIFNGDGLFQYYNFKKYKFAKLDLDSGKITEISKKEYEEKYYYVKERS